jgi:hypothetical protein
MTRRSLILVMAVTAMALLPGCAGLMMKVRDVDETQASVSLKSGDTLTIDEAALETSITKANPKADAKQLASQLTQELTSKFAEKGVNVGPDSQQTLSIQITNYDKGCGACRGFFPLFGLGNTYLNGEVTLQTPEGKRVITVEKTGQSSGMSQMGDQTEKNVGYFATSVASKLASGETSSGSD